MRNERETGRSDAAPDEERERYRSIFRQIISPVVILSPTGVIVDCNLAAEHLTGLARDEVVGKVTWDSFVAAEDLERLRSYFRDRASGEGNPPTSYTFRFVSPDRTSKYMQANIGFVQGSPDRIISLVDLSEIVKAQHRTAESEDRYRTAVENTRDGVLICREDTILFANTTFCNLTGLTREMVYTMNPLQILTHDSRERLLAILTDSPDSDHSYRPFEARVERNGEPPFVGEVSPVGIRFRGMDSVLLTVRDLTERKMAEKQLRDSHMLFKAIVDNSPVGISVHDGKGMLLLANASWRKIWSKTEEEQKEKMRPRKHLRMDRADNYLAGYISEVEKVYTSGGDLFIPRLKIPNPPLGGAEWISHHFYAIKDEEGNVDKVVVLTMDLSEAFRVRERLKETEGQYRELAQNIPVAVFRTSTEPGGRILSANPEMLRMFGFNSDEDLLATKVLELYADPAKREELLTLILGGKDVENFETDLLRKDGTSFLASISARGVSDHDGSITHIEGIVRDITSLRRAEAELRSTEKLQSIGNLAGGIAHDFNNILMGIQGNLSLAQSKVGDHPAAVELKRAVGAVREANRLSRQLLTFAEGGVPIRESVDIEDVLQETVNFMLRGSTLKAEYSFDPELMPLFADTRQISQAVGNIALNSVQAMPEGGDLYIETSNATLEEGEISPLRAGPCICISIRDTGPGIPTEDLSKIFNPYFTTRVGGTGLGLATSYSIVRKHEGAIRAFSDPGSGTEFRIYLPGGLPKYEEKGERLRPDETDPSIASEALKVLVMDDEVLVREVLEGMLTELGHRVDVCSRGEEAIEMYSQALDKDEPYQLVILDLTIPGGLGGGRTLEELMKLDRGVKAVVSSGYSNDPVLAEYQQNGFIGRLSKPFTLEELEECVRSAFRRDCIRD